MRLGVPIAHAGDEILRRFGVDVVYDGSHVDEGRYAPTGV